MAEIMNTIQDELRDLHFALDVGGRITSRDICQRALDHITTLEKDKERLDAIYAIIAGSKWSELGALATLRPEDSKYVGDNVSFRQAIDAAITQLTQPKTEGKL